MWKVYFPQCGNVCLRSKTALSNLFYDVLQCFCFVFVWCPCMAINVVVSAQHNGGFLPGIILLTQCYYHRGTRLNAMKSFFVFAAYDPN